MLRARDEAVPADALSAAVRVHADRVHDAVRRQGVAPQAAVAVVESSAMELVESAAQRPAPVPELVGRWFALASRHAQRAGLDDAHLPVGTGPLAEDAQQRLLAQGLDRRSATARAALLLRDAYDLPAAAVGAALDRGPDEAQVAVGRARLSLLPDVFGGAAPSADGHPAGEAALSRLAEGGPPGQPDVATARHLYGCGSCQAVVRAQSDVRRLVAGLSVVALPDDVREQLLERVGGRARAVLPAQRDGGGVVGVARTPAPRRLLSPLGIALPLLVAGAAGLGIGLLTSRPPTAVAAPVVHRLPVSPPALPTLGARASAPVRPSTRVFTLRPATPTSTPAPTTTSTPAPAPAPTRTPTPTPTPTAPPTSATVRPSATPTAGPAVTVSPTAGAAGDPVTVSGTGWEPGSALTLSYLDGAGQPVGSGARATADGDGTFSVRLGTGEDGSSTGQHRVEVTDGTTTRTATYAAR